MNQNPLSMLQIIRQHGNLTIPEFIARVGISPAELVDSLEQLCKIGLLEIKDPAALEELRQFTADIDETHKGASSLEKRQALFGYATRPNTVSKNTKLRPTAYAAFVA